ncbi:hypothetical protein C8Q76DRAFT_605373 [Earliella scabrosa]|nr:hypothetical protein C8Q76DRAFT_605373 [Earliella scabrosa]
MLQQYIPTAREFLRVLTECRALIGGIFALSFLLRDPTLDSHVIDVYTTDASFQVLVEYLIYCPSICPHLAFKGVAECATPVRIRRDIRRRAVFTGTEGRQIRIYESSTVSALSPISRTWTTALMNFVTEKSFACAYPPLTFARRGVISDLALSILTDADVNALTAMLISGLTFANDPTRWQEYAPGAPSPSTAWIYPCTRHLFLCPDQGRHFADRGTLSAFIDPLADNYQSAHHHRHPPYCHMAVWRLWGTRVCTHGCAVNDPILPQGVISMPAMLVTDPLFDIPDIPSDDEVLRSAYTFQPSTVRRHRRTVTI